MTQLANRESVAGDFQDASVDYLGLKTRFRREGERFEVEVQVEPGSAMAARLEGQAQSPDVLRLPVTMTTGSHHMQAYWYTTGERRLLGQVPFVYLFPEQRWVPRNAVFLRPPSGEPPPDETGRWNEGCIRCHATHGRPRFRGEEGVDTHVAEFGIACEACHGPAREHVLANRNPVRRYDLHFRESADPTIVHPARLDARASSQLCGQCHGVWEFLDESELAQWNECGYPYRPGDELSATRTIIQASRPPPEPLRRMLADDPAFLDDRFWSDGMIRVSGREYNGLMDSPCHQRGQLSCLSCHTMHPPAEDPRPLREWAEDQLILGRGGNQACTQCHSSYADAAALTAHAHHAPASHGARCYNCHMPHTTYGLLKAIRSHQIDSPDVAASLATGRPNACNLCHLDKSLGWTADHLSEWYQIHSPPLDEDQQQIAASLLWMIRGDAGQRALLVWAMGWEPAGEASGTEWMIPFLAPLLDDPYDAVRLLTCRTLKKLPGYDAWDYDFLAPSSERVAAGQQLIEIWNDQRARDAARQFPEGVRTAAAAFTRLYEQRNDREVFLSE